MIFHPARIGTEHLGNAETLIETWDEWLSFPPNRVKTLLPIVSTPWRQTEGKPFESQVASPDTISQNLCSQLPLAALQRRNAGLEGGLPLRRKYSWLDLPPVKSRLLPPSAENSRWRRFPPRWSQQ